MKPILPALTLPLLLALGCTVSASAAVSLDCDVAALRNAPGAAALLAANAEQPFFPRLAAAAALKAQTGHDPLHELARIQVTINDAGADGVVERHQPRWRRGGSASA